jgi:hypothetical protein
MNSNQNKAYDADFGFKFQATVMKESEYSEYFHERSTIPVYAIRNRTDIMGNYLKPFYNDKRVKEGFQCFEFPGEEQYQIGICFGEHEVDDISVETVMTPGGFDREVLVISYEGTKERLYLDCLSAFRGNIFGKSLKLSEDHGNVYQGMELIINESNEIIIPENMKNVLVKIVPYEKPMTQRPESFYDLNVLFEDCEENPIRELTIMKYLSEHCIKEEESRYFPQFYDACSDEENFYLISSFFQGSTVRYNKCLPKNIPFHALAPAIEKQVRILMKQVFEGIRIMHSHGLSHLDISAENLVFEEPAISGQLEETKCAIIDFGRVLYQEYDHENESFKKHEPHGKGVMNHGKYYFFCPELENYKNNPYYIATESFSPMKVDIWQLGILLLMFLTNEIPFKPVRLAHKNTLETFPAWMNFLEEEGIGSFAFQSHRIGLQLPPRKIILKEFYSEELVDLLELMLTRDHEDRISIEEVLVHPWVTGKVAGEVEDEGVEEVKEQEVIGLAQINLTM